MEATMNGYLTKNEVIEMLPVSRATFFRTTRNDPSFPQSEKIGAREVWLKSDIEEYAGMNLHVVEIGHHDSVGRIADKALLTYHDNTEYIRLFVYERFEDALAAKLTADNPIRLVSVVDAADIATLREVINPLIEANAGDDDNEIARCDQDFSEVYYDMFPLPTD
jgi:predicted DNA-binding transcriptional regulator AlpA